jgi:hypothetical protein
MQNPQGNFTIEWWDWCQLPRLRSWRATRPASSKVLTERFQQSMGALGSTWRMSCAPFLDQDITAVSWDDVKAFPDEVARIKQVRSPVFTSKFCHFLLPRVYPVIDNAALGAAGQTYGDYFRRVQDEWAKTGPAARTALIAEITQAVEAPGQVLFPGFPLVNKIIELRIIGRNHAG